MKSLVGNKYNLNKYKSIFKFKYPLFDESEIEDLVQEGFLKLIVKEQKNEIANDNIEGLIYTTINNLAIDRLRIRNRYVNEVEDTGFHSSEKIDDYIKSLLKHFDKKNIMHMVYYQGFTYKEVAEIFNMPINSVKSYIHFVKKRIQKCLNQESLQN